MGNQDSALDQAQAGIEKLAEQEVVSESFTSNDWSSIMRDYSSREMELLDTFASLEACLFRFRGARQQPRKLLPF
jgi:7,8-dihydro-6-hydroxymethylpterin-pyrophosphokinase